MAKTINYDKLETDAKDFAIALIRGADLSSLRLDGNLTRDAKEISRSVAKLANLLAYDLQYYKEFLQ